jgi:hypothetical protein
MEKAKQMADREFSRTRIELQCPECGKTFSIEAMQGHTCKFCKSWLDLETIIRFKGLIHRESDPSRRTMRSDRQG